MARNAYATQTIADYVECPTRPGTYRPKASLGATPVSMHGTEGAAVGEPGEPPPTDTLPGDTTEAELHTRIHRLAKTQGWQLYHTWRSDHSEAGFPDLVLVKPGRLIFAELKSRSGKLTPAQHTWLDLLGHTLPGVEVYTWRPTDWPAITAMLTRKDAP